MDTFRIALASLRLPAGPNDSVALAVGAIEQASVEEARIVCFPECFVPGYRGPGKSVPPLDVDFLSRAWSVIAAAAAQANITVILGTERLVEGAVSASALVINSDGS